MSKIGNQQESTSQIPSPEKKSGAAGKVSSTKLQPMDPDTDKEEEEDGEDESPGHAALRYERRKKKSQISITGRLDLGRDADLPIFQR